ncbi:porin [Succinivibrio dextrinosolvens DSM 3072]|uniref:Porin n=1 Tax=Succinivibrio dextrinosolvens DSM 3072 TaxID=1123324 RepID=A0A1T4W2A3_9GAMM|nr:porin [Succinivibrio dextrinosolvens]SKA71317.1 porin [Succinivibrio dextrinosolvens DSM 3072]
MKKTLLALSVIAAAASANAATVYDKDGTSLTLDGRVQSVFYNGNYDKAAQKDSSIQNSARFGIGGKTQITDWVAGLGYAQWDATDGAEHESFDARDQYVGADFGEFGLVKAGRFLDSTYSVEAATDIYEDAAGNVQGKFNGERRGGQLQYTYDNYGFFAQAGVQTAQDKAAMIDNKYFNADDSYAIDSGFNGALGYTIDDVVFGPLSFKAGYSYVKGQSGNDLTVNNANVDSGKEFNNFKHANASIAWGNVNSGFYVAALYEHAALRTYNDTYKVVNDGFELAAGYAFDNGVSVVAGYENSFYHKKNLANGEKTNKAIVRRIPVFVNYTVNENFNVWTEAGFNAGSSASAKDENALKSARETVFSVGARYTF